MSEEKEKDWPMCQDCEFFKPEQFRAALGWGKCELTLFNENYDDQPTFKRSLAIASAEGIADLDVSRFFGCVQFQKKEGE